MLGGRGSAPVALTEVSASNKNIRKSERVPFAISVTLCGSVAAIPELNRHDVGQDLKFVPVHE